MQGCQVVRQTIVQDLMYQDGLLFSLSGEQRGKVTGYNRLVSSGLLLLGRSSSVYTSLLNYLRLIFLASLISLSNSLLLCRSPTIFSSSTPIFPTASVSKLLLGTS